MKIIICCIIVQSFYIQLVANEIRKMPSVVMFSRKDVRNGKVPNKRKRYLEKYVENILALKADQAYKPIVKYNGDFGIPPNLPDRKLQDFLLYKMGHYRSTYPMLGREARHLNIRFEWQLEALTDLYYYYDNEKAKDCAINILAYAVRHLERMDTEDICRKITNAGAKNLWHPLMINAANYYSQLYELTGNEKYAQRTINILKRFGEVFSQWKIYYKNSPVNLGKSGEIFISKNNHPPYNLGYGYLGNWGDVHDLLHFKPLLYAYTRVRNSKTYKQNEAKLDKTIKKQLLEKIVERNLLFPFRPLHNQSPNRIIGIACFGKFLNSPEYIHQAISWTEEIFHIGFYSDGMWSEGTPSYAYGILKELSKAKMFLNGWTDPKKYLSSAKNGSLTNFNFDNFFRKDFERAETALKKLTLPNGHAIAFEDSIWNQKYNNSKVPTIAEPFLMGPSGIGMLGFGRGKKQVRLYLHWEGINNHDHYDGLGFTLWANNEEISSETAYRGLNVWNRSSHAHNTVVVDNRNQEDFRTAPRNKVFSDKLVNYPHYQFGKLGGRESSYAAAGQVLLWDTRKNKIQLAQISGEKYYRNCKEYLRTMILVKSDNDRFYIVDMFKISGGKIHDYMLHGNLSKKYKIMLANTEKFSTQLSPFLRTQSQMKSNNSFHVIFKSKSPNSLITTVAGAPATLAIIAKGPSVRRGNEPSVWDRLGKSGENNSENSSEYLLVRREGGESCFAAVHEVGRKDKSIIKNVHCENNKITVETIKGEDYFEIDAGKVKAVVNNETFSFGFNIASGKVLAINSIDKGSNENSFILEGKLPGVNLINKVIFIIDGARQRLAYSIKDVKKMSSTSFKVIIDQEIGLSMKKDLLIMNFYPNWDIQGSINYQIDLN